MIASGCWLAEETAFSVDCFQYWQGRLKLESIKSYWYFSVSNQSLMLLVRSAHVRLSNCIFFSDQSQVADGPCQWWHSNCHQYNCDSSSSCLPAWSIFTTRKLHFPQGVQWRPARLCRKEINCNPDWLRDTLTAGLDWDMRRVRDT